MTDASLRLEHDGTASGPMPSAGSTGVDQARRIEPDSGC
ncbi:hypothetical protein A7982_12847 [Minicystis rosea]|nr:hypothetical protein A7982_12847 [Minicystis rosea]